MDADNAASGDVAVPHRYTAAQRRIIHASFGLFAGHGVSGTSLQMIADSVGVTKAAVYHQFKTKDEIVLAVAETEMARLEAAIADAERCGPRAREVLLGRVIDIAVERRRLYNVMQSDPYMARFLAEYAPFQHLMERLFTILADAGSGTDMRVRAAMLMSAIGSAAIHPLVVDLDDDLLHAHLLEFARDLFRLPEQGESP